MSRIRLRTHQSKSAQLGYKLLFNGFILLLSLLPGINGCTSMLINQFVDPLTNSIQNQTDLDLINEGTPALLLILDGLIAKNPVNKKLLITGTQAYISYASIVFDKGDLDRAVTLSNKAKDYGLSLLCLSDEFKNSKDKTLNEFENCLPYFTKNNVDSLFWGGFGWATWVQYQNGAPDAIADLPKIEKIMLRVLELDESYYYGAAHLFLGYYYGSRPIMFGGQPEKSRDHFERALKIADRHFLLTHISYAETYARLTYNRELFENLLNEVLNDSHNEIQELNASNLLAKKRARRLLEQIDDYF